MTRCMIFPERSNGLRLDILISLTPALVWAVYLFGARVLTLTVLSVAAFSGLDFLRAKLCRESFRLDLDSVVTGVLIAFNLSATASYLTVVLMAAIAFAVKLINHKNPVFKLNTVLFARGLMTAIFADMKYFPAPFTHPSAFRLGFSASELSDMSVPTPLAELTQNKFTTAGTFDLFVGNSSGFIGEVSALMLTVGGIYLLLRGVYSPHIPLAYIAAVTVIAMLFPQNDNLLKFTLSSVFCGSTVFCAFFIAPMFGTCPVTPYGKILFGLGCGILTMVIRYCLFSEGCVIAVLIMNVLAPYLDLPFREKKLYKKTGAEKQEAQAQQ